LASAAHSGRRWSGIGTSLLPDFDAIGVALAARFAPAAVTPPVGGYVNIRSSSAYPTAVLGPLPCILVIPTEGEFTGHGSGKREGTHRFAVRFYFSQTGTPEKEMKALLKWLTVLVDQTKAAVQLGGTVEYALVETWRVGKLEFGGQDYAGIELMVHVEDHESWIAVA
jgi:hypothetical protein